MIVYQNLILAMEEHGTNSAEMAAAVGLSLSSFRRRLRGETAWKLHEVVDICTLLSSTNPNQLFLRLNYN